MRLSNIQFAAAFKTLCSLFTRKADTYTLEQWWKQLKPLSHLKEAMGRANVADRFPSVSQIISYNYDFMNETKPHKADKKHKSDKIFILDLIMEYNKDPSSVWKLVDTKQLKIPRGYADVRRDEGRRPKDTVALFLSNEFIEVIPNMRRAKAAGGFFSVGQVLNN